MIALRVQKVTLCPMRSQIAPQMGDRKIGMKNGMDISHAASVELKLYLFLAISVDMLLNGRMPPYTNKQLRVITQ